MDQRVGVSIHCEIMMSQFEHILCCTCLVLVVLCQTSTHWFALQSIFYILAMRVVCFEAASDQLFTTSTAAGKIDPMVHVIGVLVPRTQFVTKYGQPFTMILLYMLMKSYSKIFQVLFCNIFLPSSQDKWYMIVYTLVFSFPVSLFIY